MQEQQQERGRPRGFFSTVIDEARQRRGMSRGELARRMGLDGSAVRRWTTGGRAPCERTLIEVARKGFGLSLAELLVEELVEHFGVIRVEGSTRWIPDAGLLGNVIRGARQAKAWSQATMASKFDPPIHQNRVSQIENGAASHTRAGDAKALREETFAAAAAALGMTEVELLRSEFLRMGLLKAAPNVA